MSLPNKTDEQTLDYGYAGTPYADIAASTSINTATMDYGYAGVPFVVNPSAAAGPAHLKTMFGIAAANIKTINGVPLANIKTLDGLV